MLISDYIALCSLAVAVLSSIGTLFAWAKAQALEKKVLLLEENPVKALYVLSSGSKKTFIKLLNKKGYKYEEIGTSVLVSEESFKIISGGRRKIPQEVYKEYKFFPKGGLK